MTTAMLPSIELRDYQIEATDALFDWIRTKQGWPLIVMPTGIGKSVVIANNVRQFADSARTNGIQDFNQLVLTMQSELIVQNAAKLRLLNDPRDVGIYNAKLKQRDLQRPITVGSIQSLVNRAYDKPFHAIHLDECHQLADKQTGQYRTFLAAQRLQNPDLLVVGYSATPYKLSSGRLDQGKDALFAGTAYEYDVMRGINDGWLTRPVTPKIDGRVDLSGVHTRGGEYIATELAAAVDVDAITERAVDEMVTRGADRSHWVCFACNVEHAKHVAEKLTERGIVAAVVYGELATDERKYRLDAFERGEIRCLVSVDVLSTGWDSPRVSLISLLRPTKSASKYVQYIGRGMRIFPGKTDCLILDHCNLVEYFGPIDAIRVRDKAQGEATGEAIVKVCSACEEYRPAGERICKACGHPFPEPAKELYAAPSTKAVTSDAIEPEWHDVTDVLYARNAGKNGKRDTLRVIHECGFRKSYSQFVCIEHDGFARRAAEKFWNARSPERCPATIEEALALAEDLRKPTRIATRPQKDNPKYSEICAVEFAEDPTGALPRACWSCLHFSTTEFCAPNNATVPSDAVERKTGCHQWQDADAALPF